MRESLVGMLGGLVKIGIIFVLLSISTFVFAMQTIVVGASITPQAEMLKFIQPALAKQGYTLQIKEFSDYITPNLALANKELDANFFQHQPYLDEYNKDHHTDLVSLVKVHLEPMGVYVNQQAQVLAKFAKTKLATDIQDGAKVGIPNDPTNEGRALAILQSHGIIKLKSGVKYATKKDIIANSRHLNIIELDSAMLPRMLTNNQLDMAVINANYALQASFNPTKDAILLEAKNSPYANIVAVRRDELGQARLQALKAALTSFTMRQFINQHYHGAVLPAF